MNEELVVLKCMGCGRTAVLPGMKPASSTLRAWRVAALCPECVESPADDDPGSEQ